MFNESTEEIKVYWFFSIKTLPDKELIDRLNSPKHEMGLHIINFPYNEMKLLEETTKTRIKYYTIHGTAHLLTRFLWRRWKAKFPEIPKNFTPQSFHRYPTLPLDVLCYKNPPTTAYKIVKESINEEKILEIHPDWLFQRGKINQRGPYYNIIRKILKVDKSIPYLAKRKKAFVIIARDSREYTIDIFPEETYLKKLKDLGVDVFSFIKREWSSSTITPKKTWIKTNDNVALLQLKNYDEWWSVIGKKTRNMVRKAEKTGVITRSVAPNSKLAKEICLIYNETPIRQNRYFPHYRTSLKKVEKKVLSSKDHVFIGSYFENKLVGFVDLIIGKNIAIISQLLSLKEHWDKAVNNSLIAKTVKVCVNNKIKWLMYGRMGNHPSLDKFKHNTGFNKFSITRYYLPLNTKGKVITKLGLHQDLKDLIPKKILYLLLPIYNWISRARNKM
jgi:hypothetical protein